MSSYRSAYENYYKNINNTEKGKKDKSKNSLWGGKSSDFSKPMHGISTNNNSVKDFLIKRIISELTGATILLIFFATIKYVPSANFQEMHIKCKQALSYEFNYDGCIEAFNKIEIGNTKGKDLRIGNFTTEDLKTENLKVKASNFMEYLKNNNMQN